MRTRMLLATIAIVGVLALCAGAAGNGPGGGQGPGTQPPMAELTDVEAVNILHMRQEEKLARDVYLHFAEKYECLVFANITASEQRHMDAVALLITKYGLEDSAPDDTPGVFSSDTFTQMYDNFCQAGDSSLLDALNVGVQIEKLDIDDLEQAIAETEKSDIQWVFGNLLTASEKHLAAFTRSIDNGGSCTLQNGTAGQNGQAGVLAAGGRGRGGRGNGQGRRNGGGNGSCGGQQKRDGSCLTQPSA